MRQRFSTTNFQALSGFTKNAHPCGGLRPAAPGPLPGEGPATAGSENAHPRAQENVTAKNRDKTLSTEKCVRR
jgi:hypothetical protein